MVLDKDISNMSTDEIMRKQLERLFELSMNETGAKEQYLLTNAMCEVTKAEGYTNIFNVLNKQP